MKRVIVLLILVAIIGCGKENSSNVSKKENLKVVKSLELNEQKLANVKNYNGELKPKEEMKIVTPTGGDIKEIYFKNGDRVKKER